MGFAEPGCFGVDAECAETRGQVLDPLWWCPVVWQRDSSFAAPQHDGNGDAPNPTSRGPCRRWALAGANKMLRFAQHDLTPSPFPKGEGEFVR